MLKWELSIYCIVDVLYCTLFLIYCSLKCANGAVHVTRVWLKKGFWSGFALEIKWQPINYTKVLTSHTVNCIGKLTNLVSNKNRRLVTVSQYNIFLLSCDWLSHKVILCVALTSYLASVTFSQCDFIYLNMILCGFISHCDFYVFYLTIWLSHLVSISVTLQ